MGRREPDIFDLVKKRKKDIDDRQKTVDEREKKAADREEKDRDPILKDQARIRRQQEKTYGHPTSRRKVLAEREKSGVPMNLDDSSGINTQRSFNLNQKRQFIVAMTNPAYHCPRCRECKTKMSEWFVSQDHKAVMCRSCVLSFGWEINTMPAIDKDIKLYTSIIRYYKIDATDLCRTRVRAGYSVRNFAELVGWTLDYQYKLENGTILTLNERAMDDLVQAFNRTGIYITRSIWGEATERYILNGKLIKLLRIDRGLSMRLFAKKVGWSKPYQHKIEKGNKTSVNKTTLEILRTSLTD